MRHCALNSGATRAWYYRSSYQNALFLVICQWQSPDSTSETLHEGENSVCASERGLDSVKLHYSPISILQMRLWGRRWKWLAYGHKAKIRFVGSQYGVLSIIPSWRGLRTAHSLAPRQTPKYDHFNFRTRQGKLNWYLYLRLHPSSLRFLHSAHASGCSAPAPSPLRLPASPRPFPARMSA